MATTVTMPQLGETVTEGTILSWAKQVGDEIAVDEVLVEISTDKVDTEMPSPVSGVIERILVEEGETVEVGTELVVIAGADEAPAAATVWSQQGPTGTERPPLETSDATEPEAAPESAPAPEPEPVESAPVEAAVPVAAAAATAVVSGDVSRRAQLSPVVRKLAAEHAVDLDQVTGTGTGGRITRKDVETFVASGGAAAATKVIVEEPVVAVAVESSETAQAPAADEADGVTPMSKIRRVTAEHMVASKQTSAHVWTSVEVDFEPVARARQAHGPRFRETEGFSLTYLPFISRATIDALGAYPAVNSSFDLEAGTQTFNKGVGLGIAVDLSQGGLIVLTLPEADSASLTGLARDIRGVAQRARDGKLHPDDLSTSTFTITNPGPFGSFMSAPIINQPNVAILSTDTVVKRPTVVTLPDGTDAVAIRHIGYLGLSWDHRAFDGSTAVLFLARIKENLQSWDWEQELR